MSKDITVCNVRTGGNMVKLNEKNMRQANSPNREIFRQNEIIFAFGAFGDRQREPWLMLFPEYNIKFLLTLYGI